MNPVQVLPADVIAKIAAGEVVERPASVLKELLENALDAGATRVEVALAGGGKTLVEVRDDGSGISRNDLDVLFTRHATSKLRTGEDLQRILSFGFRGEALYSIGSVAELTLRSRARGSQDGYMLQVRGGVRAPVAPAAVAGPGTHIRVEELFVNTPARKKFLKSDTSEFDACAAVFVPCALLFHDRHLVLRHNNRTVYDLPPGQDPAARAAQALSLEAGHIITLDNVIDGDVRFRALLGDINISRPRRDLQFVFVNGRPVQSKGLSFHMNDIYRLLLPEGAQPFFALFVDLPPADVDVNVHPAKREVRIRDEARLGGALRRAVERALMTGGGAKQPSADVFPFPPSGARGLDGIAAGRIVVAPGQRGAIPEMNAVASQFTLPLGPGAEPFTRPAEPGRTPPAGPVVPPVPAPPSSAAGTTVRERLARARFIGTFLNKYHLFEEGAALFLLDQHAAQERVMFERFTDQMSAGRVEVQRLLAPLLVRLDARAMAVWESRKAALAAAGFESDLAGRDAVAVHTAPRVVPATEAVFRSLLDADGPRNPETPASTREALARRACRASVMSGDRMAPVEAVAQLQALLSCRDAFTCPHGRPVFIEIRESFLDRQFLRTAGGTG